MKRVNIIVLCLIFAIILVNCTDPVPTLSTISPDTKVAHMPTFILTAYGTDFSSTSQINFNGVAKSTNYISATELSCEIQTSEIASGPTTVPVFVTTSNVGDSNTLNFNITASPVFNNPIRIEDNAGYSRDPDIAADSMGNVNVVWMQEIGTSGDYEIFYTRSEDMGLSWSPSSNISNNVTLRICNYPHVAVDRDDVIKVIWDYHSSIIDWDIYFRGSSDGVSWTPMANASNTPGVASWSSALAIDDSNDISVVWTENMEEIYFSRSTDFGSSWSTAINVSNTTHLSRTADVAVDSGNYIYVVWNDCIEKDTPTWEYDIFFTRSTNNGVTWSPGLNISNSKVASFPKIATDSNGNIYVVYDDDIFSVPTLKFIFSTDHGVTWSQPQNLTSSPNQSRRADIVVDAADNINIVFKNLSNGIWNIHFRRSIDLGINWENPINLSNNTSTSDHPYSPAISVDGFGNVYVVWDHTDNVIYFTSCAF